MEEGERVYSVYSKLMVRDVTDRDMRRVTGQWIASFDSIQQLVFKSAEGQKIIRSLVEDYDYFVSYFENGDSYKKPFFSSILLFIIFLVGKVFLKGKKKKKREKRSEILVSWKNKIKFEL